MQPFIHHIFLIINTITQIKLNEDLSIQLLWNERWKTIMLKQVQYKEKQKDNRNPKKVKFDWDLVTNQR